MFLAVGGVYGVTADHSTTAQQHHSTQPTAIKEGDFIIYLAHTAVTAAARAAPANVIFKISSCAVRVGNKGRYVG